MSHASIGLSKLENASLTAELTKSLYSWTLNEEHPGLGNFGAKTIGFMTTPLTSLIGAIVHAYLFVGTAVTGLFISTYNMIARQIDTNYLAPTDLEFSSSLIHLSRVIGSLFEAVILPFIMLFDPERGYHLSQESAGSGIEQMIEKYQDICAKLMRKKAQIETLKEALQQENNEKTEKETLIKELQVEIQQLKDDAGKCKEACDVSIAEKEKILLSMKKTLKNKENEKKDLENKLSFIETELEQKKQNLADALIGKVDDLSLITDKEALTSQVESLKKDLASAKEKLAKEKEKFEVETASLESEKKDACTKLEKSQKDLTRKELEFAKLKVADKALKVKLCELENVVTATLAQFKGAQDALEVAKQEKKVNTKQHEEEVHMLQAKLKIATDEKAKIEKSLKASTNEIEEKKQLLESLKSNLDQQSEFNQGKIILLQKSLTESTLKLAEREQEYKKLVQTNEELILASKEAEAAFCEKTKEIGETHKNSVTELSMKYENLLKEKETSLVVVSGQLESLSKDYESAKENFSMLKQKQSELTAHNEKLKKALQVATEDLDNNNTMLSVKVNAFENEIVLAKKKIKEFEELLEGKDACISELSEKLATLKIEYNLASGDYAEFKEKYEELLLEKMQLEADLEALEDKIDNSNTKLSVQANTLEDQFETIELLKAESFEKDEKLKELASILIEKKEEIASLFEEGESLKLKLLSSNNKYEKLLQDYEFEIQDWTLKFTGKEAELSQLDEQATQLVFENKNLTLKLKKAKEKLQESEEMVTVKATSAIDVLSLFADDSGKVEEEEVEFPIDTQPTDVATVAGELTPQRKSLLAQIEFNLPDDLYIEDSWNSHIQTTSYATHVEFQKVQKKLQDWISNPDRDLENKKFKDHFQQLRKVILDFPVQ